MDNTCREGKNYYFISFLHILCLKGILNNVEIINNLVGHKYCVKNFSFDSTLINNCTLFESLCESNESKSFWRNIIEENFEEVNQINIENFKIKINKSKRII